MNANFAVTNTSGNTDYVSFDVFQPDVYQRANYTEFENWKQANVTVTDFTSTRFCPVLFRFVWYTIIIGTLCLLGLAGNILSIITLQRDRGNQVANLLLQALAWADNALLFVSLVILSFIWGPLLYFDANEIFSVLSPYFLKYIQPVGYMTKSCAIWMTVLLAINRYIVIKRPLQAQNICTLGKARLQILAVLILSIACNIPRFFRVRLTWNTIGNSTVRGYEETSVGKGSLFYIVYTNVYTILVLVLPLLSLIFLNVSLIMELKRMRQQRNLMNVSTQPSDANITLVMCIIIVIFIMCHTPDRVLQGVKSFYKNDWWEYSCYLSALCNLLIIINSSTNFLVYFFVRKRFRRLLYQTLCPGAAVRRPSDLGTTTSQLSVETGPFSALRRLSRSLSDFFRIVPLGSNKQNAKGEERSRAGSLGNLLKTHNEQQTIRRSKSFGSTLQ